MGINTCIGYISSYSCSRGRMANKEEEALIEEEAEGRAPITQLVMVKVTRPHKVAANTLNVIALILLGVTLLSSQWASCSGDYCFTGVKDRLWQLEGSSDENNFQVGYFRACIGFDGFNVTKCVDNVMFNPYVDQFKWIPVVFVLHLCSMLLLLVATVMVAVGLSLASDSPRKFRCYRAAVALLVCTMITLTSCLIVWLMRWLETLPANENKSERNWSTGYAYKIGWASNCIVFGAIILLLLDGKKEETICQEKVVYPEAEEGEKSEVEV